MSVHLLLLLTAVLLLMCVPPCPSETYTFNQNIGVAFEFKVHVDAGKEECFGQYVQPGATFYVAFQVRDTYFPIATWIYPLSVRSNARFEKVGEGGGMGDKKRKC